MKTISGLKGEIDQLKAELSNQNIDLQEMKADNVALVEMSEHRDYELQRLKNELSNVFEKNRKLKEEKNGYDDQVFFMKIFYIYLDICIFRKIVKFSKNIVVKKIIVF